ncbi:MAG: PilZ domain-containing protein [Phycisphaerales bacterium]|nr:MAG: PilZ domain-containing protein [Phycisphaerales bacterium]
MTTTPDANVGISLSKEDVYRIVAELNKYSEVSGQDRRRSERHPLPAVLISVTPMCGTDFDEGTFVSRMHSVSRHGLAFHHRKTIDIGAYLRATFPIGDSGRMTTMATVVRRCRRLGGMNYEIGVEFCSFDSIGREQVGEEGPLPGG